MAKQAQDGLKHTPHLKIKLDSDLTKGWWLDWCLSSILSSISIIQSVWYHFMCLAWKQQARQYWNELLRLSRKKSHTLSTGRWKSCCVTIHKLYQFEHWHKLSLACIVLFLLVFLSVVVYWCKRCVERRGHNQVFGDSPCLWATYIHAWTAILHHPVSRWLPPVQPFLVAMKVRERAESREQRAESREQRAESREQREQREIRKRLCEKAEVMDREVKKHLLLTKTLYLLPLN